jgi:hypothetical protein
MSIGRPSESSFAVDREQAVELLLDGLAGRLPGAPMAAHRRAMALPTPPSR